MRAALWILLLAAPVLAQAPDHLRHLRTIAAKAKPGRALVFVDQARQLATITDDGVECWNLGSGKSVHVWPGVFQAIAASPDGTVIAALDDKDAVHLWDVRTHRELGNLAFTGAALAPDDGVSEAAILAFSPNGKRLAVGCRKDIEIWDVESREFSHRFGPGWGNRLGVIDFFPDGRRIARTGFPTFAVAVWDTVALRSVATLRGARTIRAGRLAPDGDAFAAGINVSDKEGVVQFLQMGRGYDFSVPVSAPVNSIAFSPDSRVVAVRSIDGKIRFLHRKSLQTLGTIEVPAVDEKAGPLGLAFAPGEDRLAVDQGNWISVWDVAGLQKKLAAFEKLTPRQLEAAWDELVRPGVGDDWLDVPSVHQLVGVPEQTIPLLAEKLRPAAPADPQAVGRLIVELNDDSFRVREKAMRTLLDLDGSGKALLVERLQKGATLEQKRRIETILEATSRGTTTRHIREYRAIWTAYIIGSPAALGLLRTWAGGDRDAYLTVESQSRLLRAAKN